MYPHLLKIQIAMMFLVAVGGFVLGANIGDRDIATISILGAVTAFFLVDRLRWIELSGWTANIVLILILFYSMQGFIGGNSTDKLIAVANLLAYLQVALAFQSKTPRLCWQLMVLSILQIVVAAIFNLNFEYGLYFVLYFAVATIAMTLQNDFGNWTKVNKKNESSIAAAEKEASLASVHPATLGKPVVVSKLPGNQRLISAWQLMLPWLAVSIVFAFLLYHSLPHNRQEWDGPAVKEFIGTGKSKSVNLDEDGVVPVSNALIFRARFFDLQNGEKIILNGRPYFRGMALSKFVLDNAVTGWEAPYDHVFNWSYLRVERFKYGRDPRKIPQHVSLEIVLEPTFDPLLYSTMPVHRKVDGKSDVEFCRDLSALTRRRNKTTDTITSYVYEVSTLLDQNNRPLTGWPYRHFEFGNMFPSMETGSPEFQLLTETENERYPGLVKIADDIVASRPNASRIELFDDLLSHFSESNGYQYTLNYRNVPRDKSIDPVEDFVSNHRTGHCAMYASALVLMLRSQGIPARYVVGFQGGDYNSLADSYMIHGRHAHAWVEAYVPPEMCTQEMFDMSIAGPGGAWLTLDPTPPVDIGASSEAIDLARTIWQDYVISPDHNKQNYSRANSLLLSSTRNSDFGRIYDYLVELVREQPAVQAALIALAILFGILLSLRNRFRQPGEENRRNQLGPVRRFLARAAAVVSPKLGRVIGGTQGDEVPFYVELENLLARTYRIRRASHQTHYEFAREATSAIASHSTRPIEMAKIEPVLRSATEAFYHARFSPTPLDKNMVADIENQIRNLEQIIKSK